MKKERKRSRVFITERHWSYECDETNITEEEWKENVINQYKNIKLDASFEYLFFIFHNEKEEIQVNNFEDFKNSKNKNLHLHLVLKTTNPIDLTDKLVESLYLKNKRLETPKFSTAGAIAYLLHANQIEEKWLYSIDDLFIIKGNGEMVEDRLEKQWIWQLEVSKKKSKKAKEEEKDFYKDVINKITLGELPFKTVRDYLVENLGEIEGNFLYNEKKDKFERSFATYLENKKDFEDRKHKLIYLSGQSGCGKSTLARKIAEKLNILDNVPSHDIYTSTAINNGNNIDKWSKFRGENTILLDDVEPSYWRYSEFLTAFEPHKTPLMASRFYDKTITAKNSLITKCEPWGDYIEDISFKELMTKDRKNTLKQVARRFSLVITVGKSYIFAFKVDDENISLNEVYHKSYNTQKDFWENTDIIVEDISNILIKCNGGNDYNEKEIKENENII